MPWGHGVNCRLSGMGPQEPSSRGTKTRAEGQAVPQARGALRPRRGAGGGVGLASPRAGAFRPPLAPEPLSFSWGFCCRAPSLCGPRVNPIRRVRHLLPRAFLTPAASPPFHLGSAAGQTARRARGRVGEAPAPAGTPAPGRPAGASASGPGRRPPAMALGGAARLPRPPSMSRARVGAAARSGSGRRSRPPRCAVRAGGGSGEQAGAEPGCGHRGAGGASEKGGSLAA